MSALGMTKHQEAEDQVTHAKDAKDAKALRTIPKAITLTQPWAFLLAHEYKRWETRSWKTAYRGLVAIHAARNFPKWCQELCCKEPFRNFEIEASALKKTCGHIIAIGFLGEIIPTEIWNEFHYDTPEAEFGDYSPRRYAWRFSNIKLLKFPIPALGALSLWNLGDEIEKEIWRQIA